jgi:hypothetical protein
LGGIDDTFSDAGSSVSTINASHTLLEDNTRPAVINLLQAAEGARLHAEKLRQCADAVLREAISAGAVSAFTTKISTELLTHLSTEASQA